MELGKLQSPRLALPISEMVIKPLHELRCGLVLDTPKGGNNTSGTGKQKSTLETVETPCSIRPAGIACREDNEFGVEIEIQKFERTKRSASSVTLGWRKVDH
jgi:hypothetical protein